MTRTEALAVALDLLDDQASQLEEDSDSRDMFAEKIAAMNAAYLILKTMREEEAR